MKKHNIKKCLGLSKKMFVVTIFFFSCNELNSIPLKCVSINNQECRIRSEIININSNEPILYPYSVEVNKCSSSCNNINDPFAKLYVPDDVKNINVKVFNLMSRTNKTKKIKWHENCKCKCRLNASVCNNKQRWNNDKCRCECKELIDKGIWDKGFIWDPSNCKCDKLCDVGEYLDYKNCKCRKRLIDKLVEESSENTDGNKMIYNSTLNDYRKICNSCAVYNALLAICFKVSISINSVFIHFH